MNFKLALSMSKERACMSKGGAICTCFAQIS
jgi:hypothetical protein